MLKILVVVSGLLILIGTVMSGIEFMKTAPLWARYAFMLWFGYGLLKDHTEFKW